MRGDGGLDFMGNVLSTGSGTVRDQFSLSAQLSILLLNCLNAGPRSSTIFVQTDTRCRMRLMLKSSRRLNRISNR